MGSWRIKPIIATINDRLGFIPELYGFYMVRNIEYSLLFWGILICRRMLVVSKITV